MRSFKTRNNPEDEIHIRVAARLVLGRIEFCHVPNESKAPPQYRAKLKRRGLQPGVADLILWTPPPIGGYVHAALELKAPNGRPSPEQVAWLERRRVQNWAVAVAVGYDAAIRILTSWGYQLPELAVI